MDLPVFGGARTRHQTEKSRKIKLIVYTYRGGDLRNGHVGFYQQRLRLPDPQSVNVL